jgi:hypothetical protein
MEYPAVSPSELDRVGNYYSRHVFAMTAEALHSKADIAAQLGWRDQQIAQLREALDDLYQLAEEFSVSGVYFNESKTNNAALLRAVAVLDSTEPSAS